MSSPAAPARPDLAPLSDATLAFLTERHLATLTTLRADGSPHVVAVGFTWDADAGLVRVITNDGSVKVRNAERPGRPGRPNRAAVSQVDGRRWLTLEGTVRISREPADVQEAVRRYAGRYRVPRENPTRVVVVIEVDRVLGSVPG
ncbi:pyridoxamine 5'-phosphate oxidase family protein [Nakamurella leprariae]|uniref:TIGR03618 family F420-dependent PPOX class oxidoreductase n=1 Tax=Nakamurella leprariae TaxID=2803911 RepID=A0A938YGY0_9ACTN|nr:TIGR03618 family F420-dependent PPOX class oxidoreductase [Nakamurella leprariae]MBM9468172.1 TIGR03618 family F420-dependent PPOX class oxidoreductase [Nakamurella leprariae]